MISNILLTMPITCVLQEVFSPASGVAVDHSVPTPLHWSAAPLTAYMPVVLCHCPLRRDIFLL